MKEWITLEELAGYLKLSHASLYKMAQNGEVPAIKLGRHWRFDRETIDRWMHQKEFSSSHEEFPWQDCLDSLLKELRREFGKRFLSLWIYGSWARGEAKDESDVDLLVVIDPLSRKDVQTVSQLAYEATFGRNRSVVFSMVTINQETFLTSLEPLLLNVRKEGRRAA